MIGFKTLFQGDTDDWVPGWGISSLVKSEEFWTMVIAVVVPFGWLVLPIRMVYRALR